MRGYPIIGTLQDAAGAQGNGTPLDVSGMSTLACQVAGITNATITWECSIDGTNWLGVLAAPTTTGTGALTTTANGIFRIDVRGLRLVRARISAWVSGTITVTGVAVSEA